MKTTCQKWLSLLCVTAMLLTSLSVMFVMPAAAATSPTPVDGTMDFSLLPDSASDFTCVDAGNRGDEGNVTVTKNANSSLTFKGNKGWPYAFNTGAVTESDKWADVDFTQDVYLNFDFHVKSGASKVVVYFCGQNPEDMAAIGNYLDLNALILDDYDPLIGGTPDDLGVGFYQGSINLKDLYVDVDYGNDPYINRDLVLFKDISGTIYTADQYADADPKPEIVRTFSYISGFKVFTVNGAEVIVNDISVGAKKYGKPAAVVKELNLLTNGFTTGADGESEVSFADGVYTVKVNKGWDAATNVAYGMQVMTSLKDFNLEETTYLHIAIESDTPWRLNTLDTEINKWFGFGANFATVKDVNGTDQTPDTNGFYPAGTYELCNDYGCIYTWNAKNGALEFDINSASLDGVYIEAMNPGTMKISTLKLSGSPEFKATPGTHAGGDTGNDVAPDDENNTSQTVGTNEGTTATTTRSADDVLFTVETVEAEQTITAGTVFEVDVTVSDIDGLNGIELKLGYDNTQLRLLDATFHSPVTAFEQCNIVTDPAQPLTDGGEVWATAFSTAFGFTPAENSTVLTLTFETLTDIDDCADVTVLACDATTVSSVQGGYLLNVEGVSGGVVVNLNQGDIDGDGVFDVHDATTVFYWLSGLTVLSDDQLSLADMNRDGKVTLYDAARMFYIANELL